MSVTGFFSYVNSFFHDSDDTTHSKRYVLRWCSQEDGKYLIDMFYFWRVFIRLFFVVCRMHWPIQRQSHFEASVSFGEVRDVRMTSPLWCSLTRLTPTTSNKGCRKYSPPRPHQQRNVAALTSPCVGNHLHNRLKQLEIFIFNDLSSWFKSIFSNSNLISSFTQTLVIHLQNIVKFKRIV